MSFVGAYLFRLQSRLDWTLVLIFLAYFSKKDVAQIQSNEKDVL